MQDLHTSTGGLGTRPESGPSLLAGCAQRTTDGHRSDLVSSTAAPPGSVTGAPPAATPRRGFTRIMAERGNNHRYDGDGSFAACFDFYASHTVLLKPRRTCHACGLGEPPSHRRKSAANRSATSPTAPATRGNPPFKAGSGENRRDIVKAVHEGLPAGGQLRVQFGHLDTGIHRFATPDTTAATVPGGLGRRRGGAADAGTRNRQGGTAATDTLGHRGLGACDGRTEAICAHAAGTRDVLAGVGGRSAAAADRIPPSAPPDRDRRVTWMVLREGT